MRARRFSLTDYRRTALILCRVFRLACLNLLTLSRCLEKMKKPETPVLLSAPLRARPANHPSEQKRKAAQILFDKGFGYRLVAKALNLSPNTVRDWGRNYRRGKFRAKPCINQYRYSQEVRDCVRSLREQGLSWKQISQKTGVNPSTCRAWIKHQETLVFVAKTAYSPTAEVYPC